MADSWSVEVEELLEKLRINCVNLSEFHRKRYYYYKGYSKYFRIPILILSSLNATTSVGLQTFLAQKWISLTNCFLGMCIGTITAIEMYLNITANMDLELTQSKEFYTLSVDIYKTIHLPRHTRGEDATVYLNKQFSNYTKLKEASNLLNKRLKVDTIASVPNGLLVNNSESPNNYDSPNNSESPHNSESPNNSERSNNSEIYPKRYDFAASTNSIRQLLTSRGKSTTYFNLDDAKNNLDDTKNNIEETKEPHDLELQ